MAALRHSTPQPELRAVDLRQFGSHHLEPTLAEEEDLWLNRFFWDMRNSTDLVRRFVDQESLAGFALLAGREVVGYSYYVLDEPKGLVGDVFVREPVRSTANDFLLLDAAVQALMRHPGVSRVETQLMLLDPARRETPPAARFAQMFDRSFLAADLPLPSEFPTPPHSAELAFDRYSDRYHDSVSSLIAESYRDHVDAQINDQYQSIAGARRFLHNIVLYPGCGNFLRSASFVALNRSTGLPCGLCLTSIVAPHVAHITQLCVTPHGRARGVGHSLLRQSLRAAVEAGARKCTLTVTTSNERAMRLYQRCGFQLVQPFTAFVWEGF